MPNRTIREPDATPTFRLLLKEQALQQKRQISSSPESNNRKFTNTMLWIFREGSSTPNMTVTKMAVWAWNLLNYTLLYAQIQTPFRRTANLLTSNINKHSHSPPPRKNPTCLNCWICSLIKTAASRLHYTKGNQLGRIKLPKEQQIKKEGESSHEASRAREEQIQAGAFGNPSNAGFIL